jgi:predicted Zn finger-like uncharacterized protein
MVIQCSECQTRFKLADDKMKPGGIKVRCAKCKHVFSVGSPESEVEPTSAAAVAAAAAGGFAGLQQEDSAQDFSLGRQSPQATVAATASSDDAFGLGDSAEKAIWDDFSLETSADPTPAAAIPPLAADTSDDDFDLGFTPTPEPAAAEPHAPAEDFGFSAEPAAEVDDFGFEEKPAASGTDDFDFGLEMGTAAPSEALRSSADFELARHDTSAAEDDFAFGDEGAASFDNLLGDDTAGEFSSQETQEAAADDDFDFAAPPKATSAREVFDFGTEDDSLQFADLDSSPAKTSSWGDVDSDAFGDDFDLAGEGESDKAFNFSEMSFQEEAQVDHLGDDDFGSISLQSPAEPQAVKPSAPIALQANAAEATERAPKPAPPAPTVVPARRSPLNRLVLFVLALLLALIGAAGYFLWQSGGIAPLMDRISGTTPPPIAQPQIRLTGLNGYFVTNKDAGQLFVIQGQAINEFAEIRSAMTVKGALFDKGGKLLVQQTVFCGNRLDDTALQELPFAKISEAMNNQFGDTLSNLNVAPGKAIPFTIVFRNFPPELAEFTVESVDSRPGSN